MYYYYKYIIYFNYLDLNLIYFIKILYFLYFNIIIFNVLQYFITNYQYITKIYYKNIINLKNINVNIYYYELNTFNQCILSKKHINHLIQIYYVFTVYFSSLNITQKNNK